jgi:hypothetical protein
LKVNLHHAPAQLQRWRPGSFDAAHEIDDSVYQSANTITTSKA